MQRYPPTVVWRHRKEKLKKCSLHGLESRDDFRFFRYPNELLPELPQYCVLAVDAPPLTDADAHRGLLVIDATWRYAATMLAMVPHSPDMVTRSIPPQCRTAYPRRQHDCPDEHRGLASAEAIYVAYRILGRNTDGILDNYHWRDEFEGLLSHAGK